MRKISQASAFSLIGDYALIYRYDIDLLEDLVEEGVHIDPVEFRDLELRPGDECLVVHTERNRRSWYLLSLTRD